MSFNTLRSAPVVQRGHDEIRPMSMEWGGLSRVDGSARFGFGQARAVASISGPIEVRLNAELPTRAALEVNMRPSSGLPGTIEKRHAKEIREILEQALILTQHPRTLVQVVVQALSPPSSNKYLHSNAPPTSGDPNLMAASVNAVSLAFMNASSIPMRGFLTAVAVGKPRSNKARKSSSMLGFVLDPDEAEREGGSIVFAFLSRSSEYEEIWVSCRGEFSEEEFSDALALAKDGAKQVAMYFRKEIASALSNSPKDQPDVKMDIS